MITQTRPWFRLLLNGVGDVVFSFFHKKTNPTNLLKIKQPPAETDWITQTVMTGLKFNLFATTPPLRMQQKVI